MGTGHLLVTTRQHSVKVADMGPTESREIGMLNHISDYDTLERKDTNKVQVSGSLFSPEQ